jgi:threonine/homoserine/homoserine lactone efflux protein
MLGLILTMTPISVVGFVVMLGAAYLFITAWRRGDEAPAEQEAPTADRRSTSRRPGGSTARPPRGQGQSGSFMDRMEERWRRRRDDGV